MVYTHAVKGIRTELSDYIYSAFTKENIRQSIQDEQMNVLVAEQDEHQVACVEIDCKTQCLENLVTAPEVTVLYVPEHFTGKEIGFSSLAGV